MVAKKSSSKKTKKKPGAGKKRASSRNCLAPSELEREAAVSSGEDS
jgi:hypothetical protein